jgi:UDP-3-O-acyl N-acetylglucosamine deacetylase
MSHRLQRTIARAAAISGIGFLTGNDIELRFLPAEAGKGIAFQRTDRLFAPPIPALVEYTVPRERRTAIQRCGVTVEMIEHVMAALAGLSIDNCLVELNGPEPPGCDGSARRFAEALLDAGIVEQDQPRGTLEISRCVCVRGDEGEQSITAGPAADGALTISYELNYGAGSAIEPQRASVRITPGTFVEELSWARTFVLESEAHALRAQGYGRRTTPRDLLIFGDRGVIDNSMRSADECARHKVLDCLGDLALIGCDVSGTIDACRSGHHLNAELVRRIRMAHAQEIWPATVARAA